MYCSQGGCREPKSPPLAVGRRRLTVSKDVRPPESWAGSWEAIRGLTSLFWRAALSPQRKSSGPATAQRSGTRPMRHRAWEGAPACSQPHPSWAAPPVGEPRPNHPLVSKGSGVAACSHESLGRVCYATTAKWNSEHITSVFAFISI